MNATETFVRETLAILGQKPSEQTIEQVTLKVQSVMDKITPKDHLETDHPKDAALPDGREAFEAWAGSLESSCPNLNRHKLNRKAYQSLSTQSAWEGWRACAALAERPAAKALPDERPLDDPRLQELFVSSIHGAMAFGYQGNNKPPEGHWLTSSWELGRAEAQRSTGDTLPAPLAELSVDWLRNNMTFYNTDESAGPLLASVSKRIWYHATDDTKSYPFDQVIFAALASTPAPVEPPAVQPKETT